MTIIAAFIVFIVVSVLASRFPNKIPSWIFKNLEYFLIVIALVGILTTLSQIESESRKTKAITLTNNADQLFGSILYGIEHRMDKCGVWWDIALDQTNKNPPACQVSKQCSEACRTAHMISQYRWRPIETELDDWENFHSLICYVESKDHYGTKIEKPRDPLCNSTDKFIEALSMAKEATNNANNQIFSNQYILIIIQLLTGFGLGLEIGKIRNNRKNISA